MTCNIQCSECAKRCNDFQAKETFVKASANHVPVPEHFDGEPCTLPVFNGNEERAKGFRFEYTGERRIPVHEWATGSFDKDKTIFFYSVRMSCVHSILRAVPLPEPVFISIPQDVLDAGRAKWPETPPKEGDIVQWDGIMVYESFTEEKVREPRAVKIKRVEYRFKSPYLLEINSYPWWTTIDHLSPLPKKG